MLRLINQIPEPSLSGGFRDFVVAMWDERVRQTNKFGEQRHNNFAWASILGEEYGEACKAANDNCFKLAPESDVQKGLVETAAVAAAFWQNINIHSEDLKCSKKT